MKAISHAAGGPPVAPEAGAFAFGAKLGFFGNNAPKWAILPTARTPTATPYRDGWDAGDPIGTSAVPRPTLTASRTIWTDSQGNADRAERLSRARRAAASARGSWTVFDAPEAAAQAYGVFDAREASRADYGLSGRAMALTLAGDDGSSARRARRRTSRSAAPPRYVASRQLELAELPIDSPVERRATRRSSSTAWCSASRSASRSR